MKQFYLKKIGLLFLTTTFFTARADEASELLDLIPATEAVFVDQTISNEEALTAPATIACEPDIAESAQTNAHVAMVEMQCLLDLLSKEKHLEGLPLKTAKRLARGAGAATTTALVAKCMQLCKKDVFKKVGIFGWIMRGLFLGAICVSSYEATASLLPENATVFQSILINILSHWNLFKVLIPEEYVAIIQPLHDAFVANNNELPLSEAEAKKFVRTIKYDVKRKIKKYA